MVIGLLGKNAAAALDAIERALSFNPSSAAALYFGAQLSAWSGDSVRGAEYARRPLRLSPFDPLLYAAHLALGIAALQEDRYDETAAWWGRCAEDNPKFGMIVIAQAQALALAGRIQEARAVFARGLELEPSASIRTIHRTWLHPHSRREDDSWRTDVGLAGVVGFPREPSAAGFYGSVSST